MGKYDPLKTFLAGQAADRVPISFAEIEHLVGAPLPSSKRHPAWWSNNPSNNPMTRAWLAAGYKTEQVDTAAQRLVFRRTEDPAADGGDWLAKLHAALGGTVRVAPGYDLTEPTGEIWDAEIR
jgi:hypothetical protein